MRCPDELRLIVSVRSVERVQVWIPDLQDRAKLKPVFLRPSVMMSAQQDSVEDVVPQVLDRSPDDVVSRDVQRRAASDVATVVSVDQVDRLLPQFIALGLKSSAGCLCQCSHFRSKRFLSMKPAV